MIWSNYYSLKESLNNLIDKLNTIDFVKQNIGPLKSIIKLIRVEYFCLDYNKKCNRHFHIKEYLVLENFSE